MLLATIFFILTAVVLPKVAAQGEYSREQCDMEIHLGLNQSFVFHHFPSPEGPPPFSGYHTGYEYHAPRECTLNFKGVDGCVLKYQTTHFERGDIDCREQYLLIGDENSEQRICGFRSPPSRLNSTGKYLFLTHYQRSAGAGGGHRRTASSVVGGLVRCEKRADGCPPQTQIKLFDFPTSCLRSGPCNAMQVVPGEPDRLLLSCDAPATHQCQWQFQFWHALKPLNETCDSTIPPLPPTSDGANCTTVNTMCDGGAPSCGGRGPTFYVFSPKADFGCVVEGMFCTRQAHLCFTIV